jgi:hypothetical protein
MTGKYAASAEALPISQRIRERGQRITFKLSHRKHYTEHIGIATEPTEFLSKNVGGEVAHQPEQKGIKEDRKREHDL